MKETEKPSIKLKVTEAMTKDVGRALARMGPEDLERLQAAIGDTVESEGKRKALCKVMPAYKEIPRPIPPGPTGSSDPGEPSHRRLDEMVEFPAK